MDRPWSAYALADLEPAYSRFAAWFSPIDDSASVALLYRAFATPVVVFLGASGNWEEVLDEIDMAAAEAQELYIVARPELLPLIRARYSANDIRPMVRMVLNTAAYRRVTAESVMCLGPADLNSVQRLYADEPPDFFLPSMLEDGVYCGIREASELVAIAGTHVVAKTVSVGCLGNVYTRKERRRCGLSTAVTSAVTDHLIQSGIATIVLNVREINQSALHVYERLGYQRYCNYYEIVVTRRPNPVLEPSWA